jgi:hypothetical protein
MPKLSQPLNRSNADRVRSLIGVSKLPKPIERWDIVFALLVKNDVSSPHLTSPLYYHNYHNIAIGGCVAASEAAAERMPHRPAPRPKTRTKAAAAG